MADSSVVEGVRVGSPELQAGPSRWSAVTCPIGDKTMRNTIILLAVTSALMALGACSTTTEQKAGAGAVAGAIVAGPIGAAVGGAVGAVAGHMQGESQEKPHS